MLYVFQMNDGTWRVDATTRAGAPWRAAVADLGWFETRAEAEAAKAEAARRVLASVGGAITDMDEEGAAPRMPLAPIFEPGADGLPQAVIPGAEARPRSELLAMAASAPLRARKPQKPAGSDGGLFDTGAGRQRSLF